MSIERTVIGSFPRQLDSYSLIKDIRKVVDLQLAYDIDIITDGEQRGGMIEYFEQIPGLGKTDGSLKIVGKIRPMDNLDNFHKFFDYKMVKSYLASRNREDIKVKITLTGPITLGFTCAFGGIRHYKNYRDERLYSDLSEALIPLAEKSLDIGGHLQIDEPGVSGRYVSPKFARKFLYKF